MTSSAAMIAATHLANTQVGGAGGGQHQHDLFGGVGDRRQRVGGEHGQRQPFRQQRLA